jgi:hypothetical protein
MQTVRDGDGRTYLRLKESEDSSLVRDPETGEERYVPNAELEPVDGEPPLEAAAGRVDPPLVRLVTAARDRRTLGLLVELRERGPLSVRALLADYDLCESDLHGAVAEFRAAGLVQETRVTGERGYRLTAEGEAALERVMK